MNTKSPAAVTDGLVAPVVIIGIPWRWAISPTITAWVERLGPAIAVTPSSVIKLFCYARDVLGIADVLANEALCRYTMSNELYRRTSHASFFVQLVHR